MEIFNLCFGDWDEDTKDVRDLRVSNNNDSNKVLATVAGTIVSFTDIKGKCVVYAEGSTPARTRLYQMGINSNWEAINNLFFVRGRYKDSWEWFRNDRNYSAFSVIRK